MMADEMIMIRAYGNPVATPRQRTRVVKNKTTGKAHAMNYTPKAHPVNDWKNCIYVAALKRIPSYPALGAVCVDTEIIFPRPKSHYGTGKNAGVLKSTAPYYHTAKPDKDNLEKAVLDTLTNLSFFRDDSLVADGRVIKRYQAHGEHPGAIIRIRELGGNLCAS